ncbi:MAPEG family protein [uncultured Roseobacter sp.]|uniref:MAPEG family protein n=1 Tax=uncultured Roseobacter sp. TaxID=114847 RepID=UPI0026118841|nr:MAPEG family protein [uncultured Roseobacter sp.]
MPTELTVLALAALLQAAQFALMAVPANLELGTAKTLSPRDTNDLGGDMKTLVSPRTGRLIRALDNHFEALILFTIAVLVVTLGDQSSPLTRTCAWVYLAARVAYVPAYAFGWVPWRSVIWGIGFLATVTMLCAALL